MLSIFIICIVFLNAIRYMKSPSARVVYMRGDLQAAELIHLARLCWSLGWLNASQPRCVTEMPGLVSMLLAYNKTSKLGIPWFTYVLEWHVSEAAGYYRTLYTVHGPISFSVEFQATWEYNVTITYVKGEIPRVFTGVALKYRHQYRAPMWGVVELFPQVRDPLGCADVVKVREGEWVVGVPSGMREYLLLDEYGIPIILRVG